MKRVGHVAKHTRPKDTNHWLQRGPFPTLSHCRVVEARCVQLVAVCSHVANVTKSEAPGESNAAPTIYSAVVGRQDIIFSFSWHHQKQSISHSLPLFKMILAQYKDWNQDEANTLQQPAPLKVNVKNIF